MDLAVQESRTHEESIVDVQRKNCVIKYNYENIHSKKSATTKTLNNIRIIVAYDDNPNIDKAKIITEIQNILSSELQRQIANGYIERKENEAHEEES